MRTTVGKARHRKKKRLFKEAKGNRGGRGKLWRSVRETLVRSGVYSFRDRKNRAREFRKLWIIRINAACHERGMRYSEFMHGLHKSGLTLDRKMLAEMAVNDVAAFDAVVAKVKDVLASLTASTTSTAKA